MPADPSASATGALAQIIADVYRDVARPSAVRVGDSLDTLVKIGLSPIRMLDWGYEQSREWLATRIARKLTTTPKEYVVAPPTALAIATVVGVASCPESPPLRNLFAELLLKSLDSRTAHLVHPAYAALLTQLTPEEALVLVSLKQLRDQNAAAKKGEALFMERMQVSGPSLSGDMTIEQLFSQHCQTVGLPNYAQSGVWLDNMVRLALLRIEHFSDLDLVTHASWHQAESPELRQAEHRYLMFTAFGEAFLEACAPGAEERAA